MPVVTQTQGGQSSAAINGQSLAYITQQVIASMGASVPDSLVSMTLQNVIRDYYFKSTGWREVIGPYTVSPGVNVINLNPVDQYAQCHLVLGAFLYPDPSGANSPRYLGPSTRDTFGTGTGVPIKYYMDGPDIMKLYPIPDKSYGNSLYIYMSLMPVLNASRLPNISMSHHFDGLFYGTMYRLGSMPNRPWTVKDAELLREWKRTAQQNRSIARDIAERGYGPADSAAKFPNFAGCMSQNPNSAAGRSF